MEYDNITCPPSLPTAREEYWKTHVAAQERSGLTLAEYCRRNGLRKGSLSWWRRKLKSNRSTSATLVPVSIIPDRNQTSTFFNCQQLASGIAVITRDGSRIEIGIGFHQSTLEQVLRTLGRL